MTIDEAIKHCEEVVENNEQFASGKWIGSEGEANRQECEQCATDHRELAKWLSELQEWRTNPFKMIRRKCIEEKQKSDSCNSCPWNDLCLKSSWHLSPARWEV